MPRGPGGRVSQQATGGNVVRHIRLQSPADLDRPAIKTLVTTAIGRSEMPFERRGPSPLVIKAISPKPRPRRKAL